MEKKAYVCGINPFETSSRLLAVGFIEKIDADTCGIDGLYWGHSENQNPLDLVAEWVEPMRITGFVNVYAGNQPCGLILTSQEACAEHAKNCDLKPIACVEIDVLEGHGLGVVA